MICSHTTGNGNTSLRIAINDSSHLNTPREVGPAVGRSLEHFANRTADARSQVTSWWAIREPTSRAIFVPLLIRGHTDLKLTEMLRPEARHPFDSVPWPLGLPANYRLQVRTSRIRVPLLRRLTGGD